MSSLMDRVRAALPHVEVHPLEARAEVSIGETRWDFDGSHAVRYVAGNARALFNRIAGREERRPPSPEVCLLPTAENLERIEAQANSADPTARREGQANLRHIIRTQPHLIAQRRAQLEQQATDPQTRAAAQDQLAQHDRAVTTCSRTLIAQDNPARGQTGGRAAVQRLACATTHAPTRTTLVQMCRMANPQPSRSAASTVPTLGRVAIASREEIGPCPSLFRVYRPGPEDGYTPRSLNPNGHNDFEDSTLSEGMSPETMGSGEVLGPLPTLFYSSRTARSDSGLPTPPAFPFASGEPFLVPPSAFGSAPSTPSTPMIAVMTPRGIVYMPAAEDPTPQGRQTGRGPTIPPQVARFEPTSVSSDPRSDRPRGDFTFVSAANDNTVAFSPAFSPRTVEPQRSRRDDSPLSFVDSLGLTSRPRTSTAASITPNGTTAFAALFGEAAANDGSHPVSPAQVGFVVPEAPVFPSAQGAPLPSFLGGANPRVAMRGEPHEGGGQGSGGHSGSDQENGEGRGHQRQRHRDEESAQKEAAA